MSWVVHRPVATLMVTIALFVFGMVSYNRLALNLMPDMSYPTVTIRTEAPGFAPQEVEEQVSRKVEEAVGTVQGLTRLESRSRAGRSEVLLSFGWDTNVNSAVQDARERLQRVFFGEGVQRPLLLRYDPSQEPILRLALVDDVNQIERSDRRLMFLRDVAEKQVKRALESLDGVAAVQIRGGREREIQVLVRDDWMTARGLTIQEIKDQIAAENINMPGGSILEGDREYLVRTLNAFDGLEDLSTLHIQRADGVRIPLLDVAELKEGHKDRSVLSRYNNREAVELEVYKSADANIVDVAQMVKARLHGTKARGPPTKSLDSTLPEGVELAILDDQAAFIEAALKNLRSTAGLGALLAVVILFLFLRDIRATFIIATAIPLSVVMTFAPMFLRDVSLNLMSLGGLALGVGMLVDNAVVVLENIQVHIEAGEDRPTAASKGAGEVAMAVTASTLTTICVFLPITFVEGAAGQIFGDLALSVVFSLLASLLVALFFVPMLAALHFTLPDPVEDRPKLRHRFKAWRDFKQDWKSFGGWKRWVLLTWLLCRLLIGLVIEIITTLVILPCLLVLRMLLWLGVRILPKIHGALLVVANAFYGFYSRLDRGYYTLIGKLLRRSSGVLVFGLLLFLLSLFPAKNLGQSLLPEVHQGRFIVDVALDIGTPLGRTANTMRGMEKSIHQLSEVEYVHAIIGSDNRIDDRAGAGEHSARLLVGVESRKAMVDSEAQAMAAIRDISQKIEAVQSMQIRRPALFSFDTPIEVVIYGEELETLKAASTEAITVLKEVPGLADVKSSLYRGYPEVQIHYDRDRLQQLGMNAQSVATLVRDKIQGSKATRISSNSERLDLRVRLVEGARRSLDNLKRVNINPNSAPFIPLSAVADFIESEGPSEIRRLDQQRAVVVSANVMGFDLSGPAEKIRTALAGVDLGPGVTFEITGQSEEMRRSLGSLQFALLLAIFLTYVIMASSFESLIHPFVILFTVPLALVGVIVALVWTGTPLSVVVLIGIIVLAGVVVNNAIILVDTINRSRKKGMSTMEATQHSAHLRLRPILITTLTTILGLLPLAWGVGEGAEIQQPLAMTIIAGLLTATGLTLVIIPSAVVQLSRFRESER